MRKQRGQLVIEQFSIPNNKGTYIHWQTVFAVLMLFCPGKCIPHKLSLQSRAWAAGGEWQACTSTTYCNSCLNDVECQMKCRNKMLRRQRLGVNVSEYNLPMPAEAVNALV